MRQITLRETRGSPALATQVRDRGPKSTRDRAMQRATCTGLKTNLDMPTQPTQPWRPGLRKLVNLDTASHFPLHAIRSCGLPLPQFRATPPSTALHPDYQGPG